MNEEITPEYIAQLSLLQAWNLLKVWKDDTEEWKQIYETAFTGIDLKFCIHYWLNGEYSKKRKTKEITFKDSEFLPMEGVYRELDKRETLIKKYLITMIQTPGMYETQEEDEE